MFEVADLSEEVQVRAHHDIGIQIMSRRDGVPGQEMIYRQPNSGLSLHIRPLVNGGKNRPFFKIGHHLFEEVRRDEADFARQALGT